MNKEESYVFLEKYSVYLSFKRQVLYTILFLLNSIYVFKEFNISIAFIILIFITIYYFMGKIIWDKENKSYLDSYYKNLKVDNFTECVCNVFKFDGPTFGILRLDDEGVSFFPFKENLKLESFKFNSYYIEYREPCKIYFIKNILLKNDMKTIRIICFDKKIDVDVPKDFNIYNLQ